MAEVRRLMETEHAIDDALWKKMAAQGWTGIIFPEAYDGFGLDIFEMAVALEEMGRQGRAAVAMPDVTVEERSIPGPAGAPDVHIMIFAPTKSEGLNAGYVYMHGGGFVMGSPDMFLRQAREVVGEIGCTVVSVDYRLSPETVHPGPVEDCYAALTWLHANAAALGVELMRRHLEGVEEAILRWDPEHNPVG